MLFIYCLSWFLCNNELTLIIYSNFTFSYLFFSSFWASLFFFTLVSIEFLWVSKIAFFLIISFFLNNCDSHGTLHLTLALHHMYSATASMCTVTKCSCSTFRISLSDISWKKINFFVTATVYSLLISRLVNREPVFTWSFDFLSLISA